MNLHSINIYILKTLMLFVGMAPWEVKQYFYGVRPKHLISLDVAANQTVNQMTDLLMQSCTIVLILSQAGQPLKFTENTNCQTLQAVLCSWIEKEKQLINFKTDGVF